jgi:hypothetical protein
VHAIVFSLPGTQLGWWSAGPAATFVALFIIDAGVFAPSSVVVRVLCDQNRALGYL